MRKMNPKQLRYIAAGIFTLIFLRNLLIFLRILGSISFTFSAIMPLLGLALVIAGLLAQKNILVTIGAGIELVSSLIRFISNLSFLSQFLEHLMFRYAYIYLEGLFYGISFGVLAFATLKRRNTKTLGIVAGAVTFVSYALGLILGTYGFAPLDFVTYLVTAAALLLACMALEDDTAVVCATASQSAPAAQTTTISDQIEKITQLKALVDSGILTQEEFEEKKKQLLGM